MIQKCGNYCISLIRAVIQELPIPKIPEGVTLQELFAFSKKHSVEALVYHGLCELEQIDEEDPVWQHWTNRTQMLLTQSLVQLADRDIIFETLTSEGIDLLPIKGCWLKELYPEIDYRQMSDLDILVRREDRKKISQLMQSLGYTEDCDNTNSQHVNYKKEPYTEVEMHLMLMPWTDSRQEYYEKVWENVHETEDMKHLYHFGCEDEYIYYMLHLQRHALDAGIGIRVFLDSVVYRSSYPEMNRNYLQEEFEKLGLLELSQQVEKLADCWFVTGNAVPEELKELAKCAFEDGVYGTEEKMVQQRMSAFKERYDNPMVQKMAHLCFRVFPPLKNMEALYPVLKKIPVLLPVLWLVRLSKVIIQKPKILLHHVNLVRKEGKKHG